MGSWADVSAEYPKLAETDNPEFWGQVFAERPDVLHRFLGDLYQITQTHRAKARPSRRPTMTGEGTLDEVWQMLNRRQFATEPFAQSCLVLIGCRSRREFARRVGVHHDQLNRLLDGRQAVFRPDNLEVGMDILARIAAAGGVHPSYFVEWRQMWVMRCVQEAVVARPEYSVGIFRRFAEGLR